MFSFLLSEKSPLYLFFGMLAALAGLLGYVIIDHTGNMPYIVETAAVEQTSYSPAWTQYTETVIPTDDHGGSISVPQTTEWAESWTFNVHTSHGVESVTLEAPQAEKLLCCQNVSIRYKLGRLSHSVVDLTIR